MFDTRRYSVSFFGVLCRFGSICMAMLCVQLDYFALALALPDMANDLGSTSTDLQWTMSAYMIAIGITMIPASRIGDLVGRKKVLLIGMAIFGIASLWVGLSTTPESAIAARIFQGVGAGIFLPLTMSLVTNASNAGERPRIFGILVGVAGVGTALGPIVGGGFTSTIGWRWVFLINVPIVIVGLIWGSFQLRESKDPALASTKLRNLDWLGGILIAIGVGGMSIAIDDIALEGLGPATLISAALGVSAFVIFAFWERRTDWPLLPSDLLNNRRFVSIVAASTLTDMGLSVMVFVATLHLQQVLGYSGWQTGLMFIPAAVGLAIAGFASGQFASTIPAQRVLTIAMLLGAVNLALLAVFHNTILFLSIMGIAAFCLGMGYRFGNVAVQSVVKESQAGVAAGVLLTLLIGLSGMAVVAAAATIEGVGDGKPSGFTTTITLISWAVFIAVPGLIFGMIQWKNATLVTNRSS